MSAKGDPRAAAERLERGIERYAEGELAAAAIEFEEALKLSPGHDRARQYLSWVRDVLEGKRGVNGKKSHTIDEDALRAVTEALDLDEPAPAMRAPSVDEAGWEPAPITPGRAQGMVLPRPSTIPATVTPHETQPITSLSKKTSSPTILGVAPMLTPITRVASTEDRPDSVTREWGRGTPTGQNLPPLDVPELTEDQIAELISLEPAPGEEPSRVPEPANDRREPIELEAEPPPHRIPSGTHRMQSPTETQPISLRRRDDAPVEDLALPPLSTPAEIDPLESEPTRSRTLSSSPPPPATPFAELTPPPPLPGVSLPGMAGLDEREPRDEEAGADPTNPFIKSKLREYTHDENFVDDDDDEVLPRAPDLPSAESTAELFEAARRALDQGNLESALESVESVVVESGGVDADSCLPHLTLLEKVYAQVVGGLDRVPRHGEGRPDLDPRAAFLLSRVDGQMSAEDLFDVSGMSRLEALRLLALLIQYGAVVME